MKSLKNYVKLLGKMDHRQEAWKTSRPKFTEENLHFEKVAEMDLSLNSMLVYTFEMRSSVIMRDLVFSLRPMEGWALSTRSMPINRDTVCLAEEFKYTVADYAKIDEMFNRLEAGESRDRVRDVLPCTVSSTYTFTIDYRVLISFVKNLRIINMDLFKIYGVPLLQEAGISDDEFENSTIRSSLEYYQIDNKEKINNIRKTGNIVHGHYRMKMALASQFLRQHYSKIKIDLWSKCYDYLRMELDQSDKVDIVFYIDENSYSRLMAMRAHWVIDWSMDMWGGIVSDYVKDMTPSEFWEFLPNGGGKKDPYWADVYNRITLEDPGIPCPIMCEWPEMLSEKIKEVGMSPLMGKYLDLVSTNYIKDNPDNKYRQLYLKNKAHNEPTKGEF